MVGRGFSPAGSFATQRNHIDEEPMENTIHQLGTAGRAASISFRATAILGMMALAIAISAVFARAQEKPMPSQDKTATAPSTKPAARPRPDLTKPTLYVVGYAHLDTEWRWEYPQVISEYLARRCAPISIYLRNIRTTFSISAAPIAIT